MKVIKFNRDIHLKSSDGRGISITIKEDVCEMFLEINEDNDLCLDIYTKNYVEIYDYHSSLTVNPGPTQNLKVTKKR